MPGASCGDGGGGARPSPPTDSTEGDSTEGDAAGSSQIGSNLALPTPVFCSPGLPRRQLWPMRASRGREESRAPHA